MDIKVLGTGCKSCNTLMKNIEELIEEENLDATLEKVSDMKAIMDYGVMSVPALVIDGEVIFSGQSPKKKKLLKYFK
jgi:small redox-active disulfide protein 2